MRRADGHTPRERIEAACASYGQAVVVRACMDLLAGNVVDRPPVEVFGGQHSDEWLASTVNRYWLRVWGARGLLWAYDTTAQPALLAAFTDDAWRVREMAAKVAARHLVGDALPAVVALADDPVPRVSAAATRAVERLTEAGA